MPDAEYCDDCGRIKGVGCECGLTFAERMASKSFRMGGWAPTKAATFKPPKGD